MPRLVISPHYVGPDRRSSTDLERKCWRDSHPRYLGRVALISFVVASLAAIASAATDSEPITLVRDASLWAFGTVALTFIGQRVGAYVLNRMFLRSERYKGLPERVDRLDKKIDRIASDLRAHNDRKTREVTATVTEGFKSLKKDLENRAESIEAAFGARKELVDQRIGFIERQISDGRERQERLDLAIDRINGVA